MYTTFYIQRSIQCVPKDRHTICRLFEIAVKPAGFEITVISEGTPVANNDY